MANTENPENTPRDKNENCWTLPLQNNDTIDYKVVVKMIHCTVWTLKEKLNTVSTIEILIH
jgi:hypothetical protein